MASDRVAKKRSANNRFSGRCTATAEPERSTAGMREKEKIATHNFIDDCTVEAVSAEVAVKAGELYRKYRAKGVTLASLDCLIAATALVKGCKVATRNRKHYPKKGLLLDTIISPTRI